jgi:hypothetical protein
MVIDRLTDTKNMKTDTPKMTAQCAFTSTEVMVLIFVADRNKQTNSNMYLEIIENYDFHRLRHLVTSPANKILHIHILVILRGIECSV